MALAECVGRDPGDADARMAAALLLATWTVALLEAHRTFRRRGDPEEANAVFLAMVDRGTAGLGAALAGTPYV